MKIFPLSNEYLGGIFWGVDRFPDTADFKFAIISRDMQSGACIYNIEQSTPMSGFKEIEILTSGDPTIYSVFTTEECHQIIQDREYIDTATGLFPTSGIMYTAAILWGNYKLNSENVSDELPTYQSGGILYLPYFKTPLIQKYQLIYNNSVSTDLYTQQYAMYNRIFKDEYHTGLHSIGTISSGVYTELVNLNYSLLDECIASGIPYINDCSISGFFRNAQYEVGPYQLPTGVPLVVAYDTTFGNFVTGVSGILSCEYLHINPKYYTVDYREE